MERRSRMWGEGDDRKYLTVNDRKILWKTE